MINNYFNQAEFDELCSKFNSKAFIKEVKLKFESENFYKRTEYMIQTDRRGEVVFCVVRKDGTIITVTYDEYPEGTYRIPTGGIGHSEEIIPAVLRETKEELGLECEIKAFAGVIKINIEHNGSNVWFYSYLFILWECGGKLLEDATDDEISQVKFVDINGLEEISGGLASMVPEWRDWGLLRYQTTKGICDYLKSNDQLLGNI